LRESHDLWTDREIPSTALYGVHSICESIRVIRVIRGLKNVI